MRTVSQQRSCKVPLLYSQHSNLIFWFINDFYWACDCKGRAQDSICLHAKTNLNSGIRRRCKIRAIGLNLFDLITQTQISNPSIVVVFSLPTHRALSSHLHLTLNNWQYAINIKVHTSTKPRCNGL